MGEIEKRQKDEAGKVQERGKKKHRKGREQGKRKIGEIEGKEKNQGVEVTR